MAKFYVEVKTPAGQWAKFDWFYSLGSAFSCLADVALASRSTPRRLFSSVRLRYRGLILDRRTL
jgi:hypothetical protein